MAAAALFVLIAGLTVLTYLVLGAKASAQDATIVFFPFLLTGLVLFAASALIETEAIKAFLNAANPLRGGGE